MSALKRFFVEKVEEQTVLCGEEFEHAKNVLRLGVGDEVILLDNSGVEYTAVIAEAAKKQMLLNVLGKAVGDKEALVDVALVFGYLKNADKNEFIVQKAVELGVKKIVAFSSEFSSAYMNANKLERLNKVSKEAAKQCMRSVAPVVEYAETLEGALHSVDGYTNKLFACEFATESRANLAQLQGSTAIVIGSEGGFSRAEEELAAAMGFASITLGKRILRAETAAVALTSVVMFSLGELGENKGAGTK
ncbi:MAG: 16S rRNA (uracil(1498)-N(3))-methyltransferase [Clostridia bacterium]|nr:16S rRNA (uracil(1498)-N(3))-methyltransferase [Clostridia bacterium]